MTRPSLLSAALTISALAALPALAQSTPPASVGGAVQVQGADTGTTAKTDAKDHAKTDKKVDKKPQQQMAQHPASAAKLDASAQSDASVQTESK